MHTSFAHFSVGLAMAISPSSGLPEPLVLIAASRSGARLAARLGECWPSAERHVAPRYLAEAGPEACAIRGPLSDAVAALFRRCRGLVFFLPVGAVVRLIAPCLKSKRQDPAVVAVDDAGRFAVSLLSGHAGGGNRLAERVGQLLGAVPIITTAAEQRGVPVPELLGRPYGWHLEATPLALLQAASALVNGEPLGVYQDAGERSWLPVGIPCRRFRRLETLARSGIRAAIVVTDRRLDPETASYAVVWRPRRLVLGVGCSSGAPVDELEALVDEALAQAGLARNGLRLLASLDRKLAEPAMLELARRLGLETRGYARQRLASVEVPTPSDVVRRAVGTASVAEAAAILASGGGGLLVHKRVSPHGTVALARLRT